jgi:hypothetical protein
VRGTRCSTPAFILLSEIAHVAALGAEKLGAIAGRGYYNSPEILACHEGGIAVTLPSGAKADSRFGKQDFVYIAAEPVYRCPAGEKLKYRFTATADGLNLRRLLHECVRRMRNQA